MAGHEAGTALNERHGAVVNMEAMAGTICNKPQRKAHHNASKAGVHHLTRTLAGRWSRGGATPAAAFTTSAMNAPRCG